MSNESIEFWKEYTKDMTHPELVRLLASIADDAEHYREALEECMTCHPLDAPTVARAAIDEVLTRLKSKPSEPSTLATNLSDVVDSLSPDVKPLTWFRVTTGIFEGHEFPGEIINGTCWDLRTVGRGYPVENCIELKDEADGTT